MSPLVRIAFPMRVVERNYRFYRSVWLPLLSGLGEPVFYLLGLGYGLGQLVGEVSFDGTPVSYAAFVAPAMMASSAMNGSLFETTFNLHYKLKVSHQYDAALTTPLTLGDIVVGEILWAVARSGIYSVFFLLVMIALGLVASWWAVLAVPAALLVGWVFAAIGTSITSAVRVWTDFDLVFLVVQPLLLASTTFFPIEVYPSWARPIVWLSPLYHGVDLIRSLTLGQVGLNDLTHLAVLIGLGAIFTRIGTKRLTRLLLV